MRYFWLDDYLLKKRSVTKDLQPSWNWIRYHIGGKMFAAVCLDTENNPYYINLKAEPAESEFLQSQYEDIIPGYYSDKKNWISVKPDGKVPDELLKSLLDKAYLLMLSGFSKKQQREILKLTCCGMECTACEFYKTSCIGCNEAQGKVFHAPSGIPCPIYSCSVHKHRYVFCKSCEKLPCEIWKKTKDPQLSEMEFENSISQRIQKLQEV